VVCDSFLHNDNVLEGRKKSAHCSLNPGA